MPVHIQTLLALFLLLISLTAMPASAEDLEQPSGLLLPSPDGPYQVGVDDFSFSYRGPNSAADIGERRILVKTWYPTEDQSGPTAPYLSAEEHASLEAGFGRLLPHSPGMLAALRDAETHAFPGAGISGAQDSYPLLVFSHGLFSYPSSNTAQMEHLASHGYIVLSVTHPQMSSAVVFSDGTSMPLGEELVRRFIEGAPERARVQTLLTAPETAVRLGAARDLITDSMLAGQAAAWRDDMIAAVDALQQGEIPPRLRPLSDKTDFSRLAYFGMSFGAVAVAAAHSDPRARAAINLDGRNWAPELLNAQVRVPLLVLHSDSKQHPATLGKQPGGVDYFHSEFMYESIAAFGRRDDVARIEIFGARHVDFTDYSAFSPDIRSFLQEKGLAGTIGSERMQGILNAFTLAFFERHLLGREKAFPGDLFERFPAARRVTIDYAGESP